MNWVLILWYMTTAGVASQKVEGLSKDGCQSQARVLTESKVPVVCVCVEKK